MLIILSNSELTLSQFIFQFVQKNKNSYYKSSGGRQVMDLEVNKLIFHQKKATEKVDRRWWQMEDVNKYLRKKRQKEGDKKWGVCVKRRRHRVDGLKT